MDNIPRVYPTEREAEDARNRGEHAVTRRQYRLGALIVLGLLLVIALAALVFKNGGLNETPLPDHYKHMPWR
jgi:hypothetical protein